MRRGLPLCYRGPGDLPRENFGKLWCRRSVFKPILGQYVGFQTILKASLTYFMQYFASILAYPGAVAGIQRKRKAMIRITKYLINDCSSFWIMHVSLCLQTVLFLAQSVTPPPTHTKRTDRG